MQPKSRKNLWSKPRYPSSLAVNYALDHAVEHAFDVRGFVLSAIVVAIHTVIFTAAVTAIFTTISTVVAPVLKFLIRVITVLVSRTTKYSTLELEDKNLLVKSEAKTDQTAGKAQNIYDLLSVRPIKILSRSRFFTVLLVMKSLNGGLRVQISVHYNGNQWVYSFGNGHYIHSFEHSLCRFIRRIKSIKGRKVFTKSSTNQ